MNSFYIDDITWNDLNMDDVLSKIDNALSSAGSDYINAALRNLCFDEDFLKSRNLSSEYFRENKTEAASLKKIFSKLGRVKKFSFYDYIFKIKESGPSSNSIHYILIILLLLAAALIFIKPAFGIIALIIMICVNIALYFRQKAKVEGYFTCLKYLISMISCAELILRKTDLKDSSFDKLKKDIKSSVLSLKGLKKFSWLLTNSVSGSIIDVIMDYIRMIFHVDLIRFNQMKKKVLGHEDDIKILYDSLGELELALSAAAFKESLDVYCTPEFSSELKISAEDIYHPLIDGAVPNSLRADKSILFTGSNASGKSTFLKTAAINQILSQTLYICLARQYKTAFFKVLSSMALSDNILKNESYFIVEIKSLKRIFDEISDIPVLCFIDEVLRGTNTKERIAASSQILKNLSGRNALVFAATHDIELTEILKNDMTNLHFSEEITENEIYFDYKIKEGPAGSKNAIKLLELYGFDKEITEEANKMCLL